jgi:hypothetical protein
MIQVREIKVNSYISPTQLEVSDFAINPYVGYPHKHTYKNNFFHHDKMKIRGK